MVDKNTERRKQMAAHPIAFVVSIVSACVSMPGFWSKNFDQNFLTKNHKKIDQKIKSKSNFREKNFDQKIKSTSKSNFRRKNFGQNFFDQNFLTGMLRHAVCISKRKAESVPRPYARFLSSAAIA